METVGQRLNRGLSAYIELRAAFDANAAAIAELTADGVDGARIDALYPFAFIDYVEALRPLLEDPEVINQVVAYSAGANTISIDGLVLAGAPSDMLDEFYEDFLETDEAEEFAQYFGRAELPDSGEDLATLANQTAVSLALSAWMLANWRMLQEPDGEALWNNPFLQYVALERELTRCLSIYENIWVPLIQKRQSFGA